MANNYTLSSTLYPLKPEHFDRAHAIIEEVGKETAADFSGYKPGTEDFEELEPDIQFQYEEDNEGFWFYHDESVNPDQMAEVFSRFQVEFKAEKPFTFSYAFECSKPRLDEFGGGSFAVMPDGEIFHAGSTTDALEIAERSHQYAKVVWAAEDILTLKPDWTHEQAEEWLHDNQKHIRERLIELGWEVIGCLL